MIEMRRVATDQEEKAMENQAGAAGSPGTEKRRVPRTYVTEAEVQRLIAHAARSRWSYRDATMILMAYRHGLRVSELCDLLWEDINFEAQTIFIRRAKGSVSGEHPLAGDECRRLRRLVGTHAVHVFASERVAGSPEGVPGHAGTRW
jgi:type 1 fimbriae regulatory protein FimB/type 1 fimbriae regulatory protein FimE